MDAGRDFAAQEPGSALQVDRDLIALSGARFQNERHQQARSVGSRFNRADGQTLQEGIPADRREGIVKRLHHLAAKLKRLSADGSRPLVVRGIIARVAAIPWPHLAA